MWETFDLGWKLVRRIHGSRIWILPEGGTTEARENAASHLPGGHCVGLFEVPKIGRIPSPPVGKPVDAEMGGRLRPHGIDGVPLLDMSADIRFLDLGARSLCVLQTLFKTLEMVDVLPARRANSSCHSYLRLHCRVRKAWRSSS